MQTFMQHCLFELVPVLVHHGVQLFDFSMRNKKMSTAGTIKKNPSGGGGDPPRIIGCSSYR